VGGGSGKKAITFRLDAEALFELPMHALIALDDTYGLGITIQAKPPTKTINLYNFKLVVDICCVLISTALSLHFSGHGRIVLLNLALLVSSEGIACEVRVC